MLLNRHKNKAPVIIKEVKEVEEVVSAEMETTADELTKAEIIEQLKSKGIKHDARKSEEALLELLKAGE